MGRIHIGEDYGGLSLVEGTGNTESVRTAPPEEEEGVTERC